MYPYSVQLIPIHGMASVIKFWEPWGPNPSPPSKSMKSIFAILEKLVVKTGGDSLGKRP